MILDQDLSDLAIDSIRRRHRATYKGVEEAKIGILGFKSVDLEVYGSNGDRDIEGVCTTDDVDESEEVVLPEGMDLSYINTVKQMYADHQYGSESNIGVIRYVKLSANKRALKFRARIYDGLKNPLADDTLEKIRQAGHYGISIGFDSHESGSPNEMEKKRFPLAKVIHRKSKLIEFSTTPMPCNARAGCSATGMLSGEKRFELVSGLVVKSLLTKEQASAIGLDTLGGRIVRLGGELPSAGRVFRFS